MRDETIRSDSRITVFLSSRCKPEEKYGTFRRALKRLLTETNMCSVFIFEVGASTLSAEEYYLTHIPLSDVIIFFVNNDDEMEQSDKKSYSSDGVLQEYRESRRNSKNFFSSIAVVMKIKPSYIKNLKKIQIVPNG